MSEDLIIIEGPSVAADIVVVATGSAESATDQATTCTFNGVTLAGSWDGVILALGFRVNAATEVSSVTVDGNAATYGGVRVLNSEELAEVWAIKLSGSTDADIVITLNGSVRAAAVGAVAVSGLQSVTATDTASSSADPGALTIDVTAGGIIVGAAMVAAGGGATHAWTNATEFFESGILDGAYTASGAHHVSAAGQTARAVSVDFSSAVAQASVAVAYR